MTGVALHSTHQKGYQSKLLFFHSKGGRCSFWGLLHCDDRRSPWWSQSLWHRHESYEFKQLGQFGHIFTIPVLLCFVFEDKTFCTIRVWAVFVFCYRIWACNLTERETLSNSVCPFCFLFEDFRLCSSFSKVNHGAWHVYKPWFGSSVATCRLACSEISLSIIEKKLERSPGKVGYSTIWQMAWQLQLSSMLYTLLEHALLTNFSRRYIRTLSW